MEVQVGSSPMTFGIAFFPALVILVSLPLHPVLTNSYNRATADRSSYSYCSVARRGNSWGVSSFFLRRVYYFLLSRRRRAILGVRSHRRKYGIYKVGEGCIFERVPVWCLLVKGSVDSFV